MSSSASHMPTNSKTNLYLFPNYVLSLTHLTCYSFARKSRCRSVRVVGRLWAEAQAGW